MKRILQPNFIYPVIKPQDHVFGSTAVIGEVLRPDGDWRDYTTPPYLQNRNGIETSECYIKGQQNTIGTIFEEQYKMPDLIHSGRFNALLSDGTEYGGDPLKGAESMRVDGLIPDTMMPFSDDLQDWQEFHSWKNVEESKCRNEGQNFKNNWKINYSIVFQREETVEAKYAKLREALKKSPCPISVYGVTDGTGNYISKPEDVGDTHFVEAVFLDENNCIHIRDTYAPFDKVLPKNYNADFCMSWVITKLEKAPVAKKSWWSLFCTWLFKEKLVFRQLRNKTA